MYDLLFFETLKQIAKQWGIKLLTFCDLSFIFKVTQRATTCHILYFFNWECDSIKQLPQIIAQTWLVFELLTFNDLHIVLTVTVVRTFNILHVSLVNAMTLKLLISPICFIFYLFYLLWMVIVLLMVTVAFQELQSGTTTFWLLYY